MNNNGTKKVWESFYGPNMGYIYEAYEKYQVDPSSVDDTLRSLFEQLGPPPSEDTTVETVAETVGNQDLKSIVSAMKLLRNLRRFGHLAATINPLEEMGSKSSRFKELDSYNLTREQLERIPADLVWEDAPHFIRNGLEAYEHLSNVYSQSIAYEFEHIHDESERKWLDSYIEQEKIKIAFPKEERIKLLDRLLQVEGFEKFLQQTFVGQKRFSIEGLDMLVPMLDKLIESGCEDHTENIFIGMAHRGRLNVLAHVLGKPYELIFSEFHHSPNKELVPSEGSRGINYGWSGDVKYHLGANLEVQGEERTITINLANNPSHLEFVNPVVQGMTRAAQQERHQKGFPNPDKQKAFSVLVHGDAAFPGEGVVAETLNLSRLKGYETGGTIHIIANNQLGFTTDMEDSRSTTYASDLAKGFEIPILHVNADDPESCIAVMVFAYEYRKKFNKDILIDLVGYRRFGHNEMDDPGTTQPQLYEKIKNHPTVAKRYMNVLVSKQLLTEDEGKQKEKDVMSKLQTIFDQLSLQSAEEKKTIPKPVAEGIPVVDTTVSVDVLKNINHNLLSWPKDFNVYPKLEKILKRREKAFDDGGRVDWALAETLAFATILHDGKPVRLTGQDSERGTFAHRHLVLHDFKNNDRYLPLHHLPDARASFSLFNSPLSESAVLGFEYGYSVQAQEALVLWEAQFGDFVNVAQPIIDQFIAAGRAKWGQKSSLVMLLPHGYEGQGPEHSSGRMERFLQSAAENNWTVANLTSAAQYFHILRRQAIITDGEEARPLIIMTPKSLLRHGLTASSPTELSNGKFNLLVEQPGTGETPEKVKKLVLCSGKVAIDLATELENKDPEIKNLLHIARVEQLYPFPKSEVKELFKRFSNLEEVCWVQEEPRNMGPWPVLQEYVRDLVPEGVKVAYVGRHKRSSPSTGEPQIHKHEQARIIEDALYVTEGGEKE
ncbi:2-oxoglutarate dehydrogenase E1 component [Bacillus mesophilus]|uniref:2-oxoglutarate dehydrogenase E1 component n=1 Tax=Bacillus mesophilus TaxID=1808955 RepID=A0A6M0QDA3_9BACI|nr:2-oxoglutarate dehydrogenase E1 component [Bacillus mesophilus]MBM7663462.1 2-oxoglutarate dehydrogenase E1 component [Bacillus mesophilus]NEY74187.1 2-oxoglutarate dehydrogenase E1 component [Bacillus mesophilus]